MRTPHIAAVVLAITTLLGAGTTHALTPAPPSNGLAGPTDAVFRQGMWWNPHRNGNGWDINRVGEHVFVVWYTYDEDGAPTWYTSTGQLDGNRLQADLLSHSWQDGAAGPYEVVGELDITFPGPQVADVQWRIGEHSGERVLQPFIFAQEPVLEDHSGIWFDPSEAGYGITVQTQGETTFVVLYHYDAEGRPTWVTGTGDADGTDIALAASTGQCAWCEYRPHESTATGDAALLFETESRMRVTLQFDGTAGWDRQDVGHVMMSDPPSGRPHPDAMAQLASADALRFYFQSAFRDNRSYGQPMFCIPPIVSPAPPAPPFEGSALSETNLQEDGVDEADVVKTTWDHLFSIDHIDQPPVESVMVGEEEHQTAVQTISRYQVNPGIGNPVFDQQYRVEYPLDRYAYYSISGEGLYHHAPADAPSRLFYLGSHVEGNCTGLARSKAQVIAWETGEDADTEAEQHLQIDGEILTSRVIGNRLYLVIRYRPDFHTIAARVLPPDTLPEQFTEEEFEAIFASVSGDVLLPRVRYPNGEYRHLLGTGDILVPPQPATRLDTQLTVLSAFDLRDLDAEPVSMGIMGHLGGLYASAEAAWLAGSRPEYRIDSDGRVVRTGYRDTELHRFPITDSGFRYSGSGSIEGFLDSDPDQLAFWMSEHDGALRIMTQSRSAGDHRWGAYGQHRLSIVNTEPGPNGRLTTRAFLPNATQPDPIGKPDERIYAVRFFGERGYAVTFDVIDPLYAFDLADPDDPMLLGELEIPGFSDYLHPVSDTLLLGVGMNVAVHTDENGIEFALNQGVQVGLFNVAEAGDPKLLDLEEIGWRGSHTPVSNAHHAFTWLPADTESGRAARFVIPVSVHAPVDGQPVDDPWHSYPWQSTSALMYEIAGGSASPWLRRVANARVADPASVPDDYEYWFSAYAPDAARSVIYDDRVLFYFRGGLFSTAWGGTAFSPATGCTLCEPWASED